VSTKQKKVEIDIPKISDFVHRVYIESARKIYQNVYLFEKNIMPLQQQKNMRECEIIVRECILKVISDSMPIEKILRAYMDETEEEEIIEEMVEKPEEEVKELLEQKEEASQESNEEEKNDETANTEEESSVVKVENNKPSEENVGQPVSIANATTPVEETHVTINTEPMSNEKPVENKISFNDNDSMMNYNVNEKPTLIQKSESSLVSAPKTIERLEKISKEMNEKRKEEEAAYEDDDDDFGFEQDKIKIFDESPKLELDKIDVNDVSSGLELESPPLLDDIEELS
jgi:hypothetical protein